MPVLVWQGLSFIDLCGWSVSRAATVCAFVLGVVLTNVKNMRCFLCRSL